MDLARIYWRGHQEFGEQQADRYYEALTKRFTEIAEDPFMYQAVEHIRKNYRRSLCGVDSIYYRLNGDTVEIMRILGRQDPVEMI